MRARDNATGDSPRVCVCARVIMLQVTGNGDLSGGVLNEVMDEVSKRAGFLYKESYTFLPGKREKRRERVRGWKSIEIYSITTLTRSS
jgi:hypothetical protein